jgi:hypothetical protein
MRSSVLVHSVIHPRSAIARCRKAGAKTRWWTANAHCQRLHFASSRSTPPLIALAFVGSACG